MKQRTFIIAIILAVLITVSIFIYVQISNKLPLDTWINLTIPKEGRIRGTPVAIFNDIPLPEIKNIKGDAKFINRGNSYLMGYKINFDIEHLDTTEIPSKYLQNKSQVFNGKNITALGIHEVSYDISFQLTLFDKDGFEIEKIESSTETVESGKKNELQNIIQKPISPNTIKLTKTIKLFISLDKCLTCDKK